MESEVLAVREVSKRFPPNIVALEAANLSVRKGEVHCLLGANGAGKSTLLKIIAGAYRPTRGALVVDGQEVHPRSPAEAARLGISMIYQELDLVPQLTVEQNMFLGHAPARMGFIDRRARRKRAQEALSRVGATFPLDVRVETLSVASQQLTAIARSLTMDAKIIIMDEPSASLNETEIEAVFDVIRDLARQGVAILYVSHRLGELREIGDRVTVLRGGRTIDTFEIEATPDDVLVEAIIGKERSLVERAARPPVTGDTALRVNRLAGAEGLDISGIEVRWGEVVGLAGLNGSGRTSFLKALFGVHAFRGDIVLDGKPFHPRSPAAAIRCGVALVPESRKTEGLILHAPIYKNATLPSMRGNWLMRHGLQKQKATAVLKSLSTKYGRPEQAVAQLSGGNQQKVVLSKWIINGARLLLLDEPSRGLDIGAKADLYNLVDKLADEGAAVIVASSELDEIYAACDAIWVFHEGRNIGKFNPSTTDRETILRATILGEDHVQH